MIVTKTDPDTLKPNSLSIDITPEQLHEFRKSDKSITRMMELLKSFTHLANWEIEFLTFGRLPKEKLTPELYFRGSNRIGSRPSLNSL